MSLAGTHASEEAHDEIVAVRVSDLLGELIDKKRIELNKKLGTIPSRSDVVRYALEAYLGVDLSKTEADGRRRRRE